MLTVGIDVASSERSALIARQHGLVAAAGIHPNSAEDLDETAARAIESLLLDPCVAAVGETGLDFYREGASREAQARAFGIHIDWATRYDKALVIHTRESVRAAIDQLASEGVPERTVFHCWSGDEPSLRGALDLGAYISFAGNVSFRSASDLRTAAALVPADRLLVETDSPFLAPVPHRGKSNEPAFVANVGEAAAAARGMPVEELASLARANARAFLGLDS